MYLSPTCVVGLSTINVVVLYIVDSYDWFSYGVGFSYGRACHTRFIGFSYGRALSRKLKDV